MVTREFTPVGDLILELDGRIGQGFRAFLKSASAAE
jgi:hypothetical protein